MRQRVLKVLAAIVCLSTVGMAYAVSCWTTSTEDCVFKNETIATVITCACYNGTVSYSCTETGVAVAQQDAPVNDYAVHPVVHGTYYSNIQSEGCTALWGWYDCSSVFQTAWLTLNSYWTINPSTYGCVGP
jgi:hypothetical protein